jgi:N-acetylneuraminic acid mutarotase
MKPLSRKSQFLALARIAFALGFGYSQSALGATWITNSPMNSAHFWHTATLLPNGQVLVSGGFTNYGTGYLPTAGAEIYDPATGTWTRTDSMSAPRGLHTATLLPNGKVLLVGGENNTPPYILSSAQLYNPSTGTWTNTSPMNSARSGHTATLLRNGHVLVAGGAFSFTSAELYDPSGGTWTPTGDLKVQHQGHTSTLLPNGKVLLVGGSDGAGMPMATVELYDPATETWMVTNSLLVARSAHSTTLLPNGRVLVVGGYGTNHLFTSSVEIFDPPTGIWTQINAMRSARLRHTATLLPNGRVLVAGGTPYSSAAEIFDPVTGTWSTTTAMNAIRAGHTATMLADGRVLDAGGIRNLATFLSSSELYDYARGSWSPTGSMNTPRYSHTATLISDGQVLVAGGQGSSNLLLASAERYDSTTETWTPTGSLITARKAHTATLLPNGKVLVAGGIGLDDSSGSISNAELYSPTTGTWTNTDPLHDARGYHTATLLPNGKVLVAGGVTYQDGFLYLSKSESYDPTTGTWTRTGTLNCGRAYHTAALLPNGKVLVAGGYNDNGNSGGDPDGPLASAELYDPATGRWEMTGPLTTGPRNLAAGVLLPNGKVLLAGGFNNALDALAGAELFDPPTGTWSATGSMFEARYWHTLTLMPNGMVLAVGGTGAGAELYNPATGQWTPTATLATGRRLHSATLLADGQVLAAGGQPEGTGELSSAERYEIGLAFDDAWRPRITAGKAALDLGQGLSLTGSGLRGVSEGSSGNTYASSADYPLAQLRSLESGQTIFLAAANWSTTSFASLPVWHFPPGYALATVFVNGIPSTGCIVQIKVPVPVAPTLAGAAKLANGSFRFSFSNSVGALFGVLATTNLSLPASNWTGLGGVTEVSPGRFQFTDPQATNGPRRFYTVRAP